MVVWATALRPPTWVIIKARFGRPSAINANDSFMSSVLPPEVPTR